MCKRAGLYSLLLVEKKSIEIARSDRNDGVIRQKCLKYQTLILKTDLMLSRKPKKWKIQK